MTRETVMMATDASLATSMIVGGRFRFCAFAFISR
jgi:hypothetical protein